MAKKYTNYCTIIDGYIFRDCNGTSPIHLAAGCGHVGILGSLLQVSGTGHVLDDCGYTPLHWACYNGML